MTSELTNQVCYSQCSCECKKIHVCEKDYVWNPALCNCENGKYLASLMDKIICDESIDIKDKSFNNKNNKDNL